MTIEQYIAVICAGFSLLAVTFLYLAYKAETEKKEILQKINLNLKEKILDQNRQINFYKNIAAGSTSTDSEKQE